MPLSLPALTIVLQHLILSFVADENSELSLNKHYCSLENPCHFVWSTVLSPVLSKRLVSTAWNSAVFEALELAKRQGISRSLHVFFRRVEEAYYPHKWHINTKVRSHILLRRFRVYRTISSEGGDRGVYLAYDFGACNDGCLQAKTVVLKAWSNPNDDECNAERAAYSVLSRPPVPGIPSVSCSAYDPMCEVFVIALQRLGPTLDDLINVLPHKRFDERMTLSVAIQLLEKYKQIHGRGVIHNGIKPSNICLPLASYLPSSFNEKTSRNTLYAIDFGFSVDCPAERALPSERKADTVGNRLFLSIHGHHGITQSQRDDLESLAYLLSFLAQGRLPWVKSQPQLWRVKMASRASEMFQDMDDAFIAFWKDVKGLAFGEIPNYAVLQQRFIDCWKKKDYGPSPGELDWVDAMEKAGLCVDD